MELDPEEPPSLEELQARYRKAEKIRNILTRSRSALALPGSGSPPAPPPGVSVGKALGKLARCVFSQASSLEGEGWHSARHQQVGEEASLGYLGSAKTLVEGSSHIQRPWQVWG